MLLSLDSNYAIKEQLTLDDLRLNDRFAFLSKVWRFS